MPEVTLTHAYGNRVLYISILMSLVFFLIIINLVRKRQLTERFALVWLFIPIPLILFSSNRSLLEWLASVVGIYYAPAIMIPVLFGLMIMISLYFSIKASKSELYIKNLTQEVALLRHELEQLKTNNPE